MSFSIDRQISYNGPLTASSSALQKQLRTVSFPCSLSCNIPSSLTLRPMSHHLPPKPPASKYFFHAYIPPSCDHGIPHGSTTARRIDRGESLPVNSEPKSSSSGYQESAIRTLDAPKTESVILISGVYPTLLSRRT
ncbi:hypothetical protein BDV29DRAFT_97583 [Aspergillus leporis]|uniref:Uncharacterized protein n=1 Tax=Aspergillus leporis TaxID=41062 RepID=A0A5N5WHQ7_9EURO|nr:hypothetical protein BDV29DRAFT_97583 [Aspergillus leporis]